MFSSTGDQTPWTFPTLNHLPEVAEQETIEVRILIQNLHVYLRIQAFYNFGKLHTLRVIDCEC